MGESTWATRLRENRWWALAAAAMAATGQPILWWRSNEAALGFVHPGVLAGLLAILVAAPLAGVRRYPVGALLSATFALLAYESLRPPPGPVALGIPVLFAWVAMVLPARRAITAVSVVALVVGLGPWIYRSPPGPLISSAGNLLTLLVAGVVGLLLRRYRHHSEQRHDGARLAVEHAVLQGRQAVLEERLRIARELHDSVGHSVTLTALRVEAAARLVETDPSKAAAILHDVSRSARQTMTELHRLVALVRDPGDPEEPGGPGESALTLESETPARSAGTRLRAVIARFSEPDPDSPLDVTLSLGANTHLLLPRQEEALAAIAAEALCNVTRHARGAHRVQASLAVKTFAVKASGIKTSVPESPETTTSEVCLEIANEGAVLTSAPQPGLGLQGIAERARALGGDASLKARPQGGCVLRVVLSLEACDVVPSPWQPSPWEPSPSQLLAPGPQALVGADSSVTDAGNANRAKRRQEHPMTWESRS